MSKIWMKRFALIIVLVLIVMMIFPAGAVFAESKSYVNLGDSVAFGLSDFNGGLPVGYAKMFAAALAPAGYSFTDLSYPGKTSDGAVNGLLTEIINDTTYRPGLPASVGTATALKTANIVTINIGSNNLLGPFIHAVGMLYNVNSADFPNDPTGAAFLAKLAYEIQTQADPDPATRFGWLLDPTNPYGKALNEALVAGAKDFAEDWPAIIRRVRRLAPRAEIYVNTLYNPLSKSLVTVQMLPLYLTIESLMNYMNLNIKAYSTLFRYKVVDVYAKFKYASVKVVNFSIADAIANATNPPLFAMYADPHPTHDGHVVIFNALMYVKSHTSPTFWQPYVFR